MTTQELTTLEDSAMHISMWKGSFADNYQKEIEVEKQQEAKEKAPKTENSERPKGSGST